MSKRAIPDVPREAVGERRRFDEATKENLERIIGVRGGKIDALPTTATNAQIIDKINAIIDKLQ